MKATILENGNLKISITTREQRALNTLKHNDDFGTDRLLREVLEPLICNSEYEFIQPEEIEALTSSPCLGVLGEERPLRDGETPGRGGNRLAGYWNGTQRVQDITKAWAFMDYAVRNPLQDLLDKREVIFQHG